MLQEKSSELIVPERSMARVSGLPSALLKQAVPMYSEGADNCATMRRSLWAEVEGK